MSIKVIANSFLLTESVSAAVPTIQGSTMACPLPLPKRIVTSNVPLPTALTSVPNAEPAVSIKVEQISPIPLLDNTATRGLVFTHMTLPTSNNEPYITPHDSAEASVGQNQGANIQFNDLAPRAKVPMHRTTSTDYLILLEGEMIMITPMEGYDPKVGRSRVQETILKPGDVIIQRGTMHAWENRSTTQWARTLGWDFGLNQLLLAMRLALAFNIRWWIVLMFNELRQSIREK